MTQSEDLSLQNSANVQRAQTAPNGTLMPADPDGLEAHNLELATLQAALSQMKDVSTTTLKAGEGEDAAKSARLEGEIEKLHSMKSTSDAAVIAEEMEFRDPHGALLDDEVALRQQQPLVAVAGQVCDLFVARNLHIIDVYDRDIRDNKQRAFARIFYAEGKALVFYAYDLADRRKLDQQVLFYAWGERLGGVQPAKRLGIFHRDDISDGRWALAFDDPGVLAQIDSVFVTVEENKEAVTRPSGKKRLYAFLPHEADHP